MEAVTTRGSLAFVILSSFLVFAGSAAATYPVAQFEHTWEVSDQDYAVVRSAVAEKREIREVCLPRELFCVGPTEPDLQVVIGNTGARVRTEDVFVMAGHDPARKQFYGPYAVPTIADDLRFCWEGCTIPDPFYGAVHGNVTLHVFVLGEERVYTVEIDQGLDTLHSPLVPRTWCQYAQYSDC